MLTGLLVLTTIIICGISPTEAKCTLDNVNFYPEGAHWNPVQDSQKIGAGCVNCTCSNQTISCVKQECPTLTCDIPRYPAGACCPVCEVAPIDDGEVGEKDRKCEFEGRIYEHNQFFSNNNTHITPTRPNQCVNCICQSGQIYCFLKTCDITPGCSKFYQSPDTCCPVCVDSETNKKRPEDCKDGTGKLRRNSTSWHPDVANEKEPCINCTCMNGVISCEREQCPELRCGEGKPTKGYKVKGQCCRTCDKSRRKKGKKEKKGKKKRKKGLCKKNRKKNSKKNGKKCEKRTRKGRGRRKDICRRKRKHRRRQKNCEKLNHNVTVTDKHCPSLPALSSPTDGALPSYFDNLCLPARTQYIVYRKLIDTTLVIAFDNTKTGLVEIWTFNVSKDNIKDRKEHDKCSSVSFRRQLQTQTKDWILGAASAQSVKDFQRKLQRGLKRCEKKKKGCRLRLVRRQMLCFELEDINPRNMLS